MSTPATALARGPVDEDGFVKLAALRRFVTRGVALPEAPALVVKAVSRSRGGGQGGEELHFRRTIDSASDEAEGVDPATYADAVAFLTKRPGNPFPHMVTVGRARNADVRVALAAVSKVQAYFVAGPGGWSIVDQRSRNGTFLRGTRLEPNQPRPLADGDILELGDALTLEFLLPPTLQARCR